jgi:hypothetical protein
MIEWANDQFDYTAEEMILQTATPPPPTHRTRDHRKPTPDVPDLSVARISEIERKKHQLYTGGIAPLGWPEQFDGYTDHEAILFEMHRQAERKYWRNRFYPAWFRLPDGIF